MKNLQKFEIGAIAAVSVAAFLANKVVGFSMAHIVLSGIVGFYFFPVALFLAHFKPLNIKTVLSLLVLGYSVSNSVLNSLDHSEFQNYIAIVLALLNMYFAYYYSQQKDYRRYLHLLAIILSVVASSIIS
jgi:hypothetical protein